MRTWDRLTRISEYEVYNFCKEKKLKFSALFSILTRDKTSDWHIPFVGVYTPEYYIFPNEISMYLAASASLLSCQGLLNSGFRAAPINSSTSACFTNACRMQPTPSRLSPQWPLQDYRASEMDLCTLTSQLGFMP